MKCCMTVRPHSLLVPPTTMGTLCLACRARKALTSARVNPPTKKTRRAPPPTLLDCRCTVRFNAGVDLARSDSADGEPSIMSVNLQAAGQYEPLNT